MKILRIREKLFIYKLFRNQYSTAIQLGIKYLKPTFNSLNLNDFAFGTLRQNESICDLSRILFNCTSLSIKRLFLFNSLKSLNVSTDLLPVFLILNPCPQLYFFIFGSWMKIYSVFCEFFS